MNFFNTKWLVYLKLRENKWFVILIGFFLGLSSLVGYLVPQAISKIYEQYNNEQFFWEVLIFATKIFVVQYVVSLSYQLTMSKYIQRLLSMLRDDLFENWIYSHDRIFTKKVKFSAQDKYTLGEFQARLMNDTEAIRDLITTGSLTIFIDVFFVLSCMVSFFKINKFYGITLFLAEISICLLLIWSSRLMAYYFKKVRKVTGELSRVLANLARGFRQLFYTRHDSFPLKSSLPTFDRFLSFQLKANFWDASYYSFAESLFPVLLAMVVVVFPFSKIAQVAVLATLIDLIQRSIRPIKDIASKISSIQRAFTGINRIVELEADLERYDFRPGDSKEDLLHFNSIEFLIEGFRYPQLGKKQNSLSFELKKFKLNLSKGQRLGIVGQSGSGKSTVLKILSNEIFTDTFKLSFFENNEKLVTYSGNSLDEISIFRRYICLISQDSYVFSDTLKFNITLDNNVDGEKFTQFWAKISEQIPYIKKWGIKPDETINPVKISLGQKQLISALRYCFNEKPIVLFDEVSSALDGELEEALSQFIRLIQEKVMMIIVAHRLETIIDCDSIIFLDNGDQVACDTHRNLFDNYPKYQTFFHQMSSSQNLNS
ncbi:MAG: ABC transporter ATP-binding protein [Halobacteriovoraceae bacterium]|nr:ABC transporter ATP-binding protein [Halobacteriovoraceae bacterium]MCB9095724.1 ABC transporter ATP-binding protein [Halobacteriovoraceae bacterium]